MLHSRFSLPSTPQWGKCTSIWLIGMAMALALSACVPVPKFQDRFTGLVSETQLKPGVDVITGAKQMKLAVIQTDNTAKQIDYENQIKRKQEANLLQKILVDNSVLNAMEDNTALYSIERYLAALIAPLKQKFGEVVVAKDLPSAFRAGADIVAILDVTSDHSSNGFNKFEVRYASSLVFINKRLEKGPDLQAQSEEKFTTPLAFSGSGTAEVMRLHAGYSRKVRLNVLEKITAQINDKIKP